MTTEQAEPVHEGLRSSAKYAFIGAVVAGVLFFVALINLDEVTEWDAIYDGVPYVAGAAFCLGIGAIAHLASRFGDNWPASVKTWLAVGLALLTTLALFVLLVLAVGLT